jgi:hypothetical protein
MANFPIWNWQEYLEADAKVTTGTVTAKMVVGIATTAAVNFSGNNSQLAIAR